MIFIPLLKNLVLWASCKSRYAGVRDIWLCRSLFEKEVRIQEAEYRISCLLSVQSKGYYSGMTGFGYLVADLIRTPERSDTEFSCLLYSDFSGSFFIIESLIGASQCRALWTRVSTGACYPAENRAYRIGVCQDTLPKRPL